MTKRSNQDALVTAAVFIVGVLGFFALVLGGDWIIMQAVNWLAAIFGSSFRIGFLQTVVIVALGSIVGGWFRPSVAKSD
jgi:hypothetical protein